MGVSPVVPLEHQTVIHAKQTLSSTMGCACHALQRHTVYQDQPSALHVWVIATHVRIQPQHVHHVRVDTNLGASSVLCVGRG
jgi:hypothetical protein